MIDWRSEKGFTLAEMLVVVSLLMVILTAVYYVSAAVRVSGEVTSRQALFTHDISSPLHVMDKVLSQNKAIESSGGFVSDAYTLTTRSPAKPGTSSYTRHVYSAGVDGTLTEKIYACTLGSATTSLVKTVEWSENNANRVKGSMFTYLGPDGQTTTPANARSVIVQVWVQHDGKYYTGKRQVYFRNR